MIGIFCLWNCAQETAFVPLSPVPTPAADYLPHPTLSPQEVVQIQLEALKNNAEWGNDRGIGICFQFASPKNPISTGSLNRFIQIYQPMLNARAFQQSPMKIEGDSAIQKVSIVDQKGNLGVCVFYLSKQNIEPYIGCWMTDGVLFDSNESSKKPAHKDIEDPPLVASRSSGVHPPKPLYPDAVTHDWPSFLGPSHNAHSPETHLLKRFPPQGPQLVWELESGTGYASPVIIGEHLVYLHRVGNEEIVECLHPETGKPYWDFKYPSQYRDRFGFNNGPRASPVMDEQRVYTYGAEGNLHCFDYHTGKPLWNRNLHEEYRIPQQFFGVGTTPLIEGDLLIINLGAPGGPCVIALDKQTGKETWKAGEQWGASYASPVPAFIHGERRVFVFAGGESRPPTGGLLCLNPRDGMIDFQFPWRSKSYESVNASSPVIMGNQVFITASYDTGGALLTIDSEFNDQLAWTTQLLGCHWNTPIAKEGYLYGFDGRHQLQASLVCLELATGKEMWRSQPMWENEIVQNGKQQSVRSGLFRGSLLWAEGHFLSLGEGGDLLWLDLSPEGFQILSRSRLFRAGESWTLPVLSHGLLYVAQNTRDQISGAAPRLLCYDLRENGS